MQIANNSVVSIEYTLSDETGTVLDASKGDGPISYIHGRGELVPGLERELLGKLPGDAVSILLAPEDAYGVYDDELSFEVERSQLPADMQPQPGMQVIMSGPDHELPVTIVEVAADSVRMDGNHPLAGKSLHFAVEVKAVRELADEDLADCCRAGTCGS